MKLKKIILENCIGLVKGSDLDKLEINFEDVDSSVIGIFGKNGTGKSTLLNNINPYRANFGNDFYEDGYKEIEFDFKDNNYVSKIHQDKAYLFKNGKVLNESGKRSVYDTELIKEIGDENVFKQLLYAGKRFTNILGLTKSEKKELIIDYLLEYLKKYDSYMIDLKYEMEDLEDEVKEYERKSEEFDERLRLGKEKLKERMCEDIKHTDLLNEVKNLKEQQELYLEQEEKNKDTKTELELINKDYENIEDSIKKNKTILINKKTQLKRAKNNYDTLKKQINDVKEPDEPFDELKEELLSIEEDIEEEKNKINNLEKIKKDLDHEITNLKDKITNLKNVNTNLPCSSKLQVKCPFTEYKNIDELIKSNNKLIGEYELAIIAIQIKIKDNIEVTDNHKINKTSLVVNKIEIKEKINQWNEFEKIKSSKVLLDEYKQQGKDLKKEIEELEKEIEELNFSYKCLDDQIKNINEILLVDEFENKKDELEEKQDELNRSIANIDYLNKILDDYRLKVSELGPYKEKLSDKQKQLEEYNLLIQFFGRNGGQIFDIEQAGIEISKIANMLLEHYEDKKIIVKFETLRENKQGDTKEVFDIMVSINDGDWQTYLSDGEAVLVSNAIREAMCYIRQSKDYKTVFIDELDGAIDTDNIIGFAKLLEEGNKLNERKYTFLISHNEEIKSYLEKSITFKKNNLILNL